jgi:hypothetical protein
VEIGLSATATLLSLSDATVLVALRAWHEGLSSREAVTRYLGEARAAGQSSRGVIGAIRRDIAAFARSRDRDDLVKLFTGPARKDPAAARAMAAAIEQLRSAAVPVPLIGDGVDLWLAPRVARPASRPWQTSRFAYRAAGVGGSTSTASVLPVRARSRPSSLRMQT